jgi:hypothetical protein
MIQGPLDMSTNGYRFWAGESGVLTTAMVILFAMVLYRDWLPAERAALAAPASFVAAH